MYSFFLKVLFETSGHLLLSLSFVNVQSLAILHNSISFLFPLTDHLPLQP